MSPSFLWGAMVGFVSGFWCVYAVAFARDLLAARKDPTMLSGRMLRMTARHFYGIQPRLGESDRHLRRRIIAVLDGYGP